MPTPAFLTLAQIKLEPDAPTPLSPPSPLIHYTVENPYPLAILLTVLALILFFALSARDPGKARRAALLPLLLAAATIAAAFAITTRREQVLALTRQLVADVAAGNAAGVSPALTDSARLFSPATPDGLDKDKVLNRISTLLGPSGPARIESSAILEAQIDASNKDRALVQVKVRVTAQGTPVISWWRLDAVPAGKGWHFSGIKYISSNFPIPDV